MKICLANAINETLECTHRAARFVEERLGRDELAAVLVPVAVLRVVEGELPVGRHLR